MSSASDVNRALFGGGVSETLLSTAEAELQPRNITLGNLRLSIASHSSFEAVKAAWLKLETEADLSPFQSFEWCRQFWQSGLAGPAKLEIITAMTEAGELALLMPLATARRGGVLVARMLNDGNAAHRAPVMSRELLAALTSSRARAALLREIRTLTGADVLLLEQQPHTLGGTVHPLLGAFAVNHRDEITDAVFTQGTFEAFDKAHRSSKSRSRDKKRLEGLASLGTVSIYEPQSLPERQAFLAEILDRKSEDLKGRGVHVFEDPATRDFLMRIAALDPDTSSLKPHLMGLRVGGTWAAAHFGIVHGKTAAGLIIAMGIPEAREHSPGHLLVQSVMKHMFEIGATRFSFGLGESDLKSRWADERMAVMSDAIALSPLGLPYAAAKRVFWLAKREVKHNPALFKAASRFREAAHTMKQRAAD